MDQSTKVIEAFLDLWNKWQRGPREPLTSKNNIVKVAGVLGALYAYKRLTPTNTADKPFAALGAIAALAGLALPAPDKIEERRLEFAQQLTRSVLSMSRDSQNSIIAWFTKLQEVHQAVLAEFFSQESISDVAKFLQEKENRDRVEELLASTSDYFSSGRAAASDSPKRSNRTIDRGLEIRPKSGDVMARDMRVQRYECVPS